MAANQFVRRVNNIEIKAFVDIFRPENKDVFCIRKVISFKDLI